MCTCITYKNGDFYFGRNLDLEYSFDEKVVMTPRNYPLVFKDSPEMKIHYAMIGMATVKNNYPLYAEAANEKGLAIAGLNFPGNACYKKALPNKKNITPYELIPWILGQCATIKEAKNLLKDINLLNEPFDKTLPLAPLHWMIADKNDCIVLEAMEDGIHIYDNPIGVLTNNPPFPYYQIHLSHYMNMTSQFPTNQFAKDLDLTVYGQGLGAVGIPGDFSPVSRFVKTAFLKWNSQSEKNENSNLSQFFHILDGVAMVRGSVITQQGCQDITTYSCCINVDKGIYYYKTYENNQIQAVCLKGENLDEHILKVFELSKTQNINWHNTYM